MTLHSFVLRCVPLLCCAALSHAEVLVQGAGLSITSQDVVADSLKVPEEARKAALAKADTVSQVAVSLFARRALADEARQLGLDKSDQAIAALNVARDRILSDAYLARLDAKTQPDDAVLNGLALNLYKAEPQRFKVPEEVQVRHILISSIQPDARAKAAEVLAKLQAGGDFQALAKELSADTGSAAKGGDLGSFGRGKMVPPFEAAAFALQAPGDLSELVETQFGFHILQLVEKKPERQRSFEEVQEALRRDVLAKARSEARTREVQRVVDKAQPDEKAIEAFSATFR